MITSYKITRDLKGAFYFSRLSMKNHINVFLIAILFAINLSAFGKNYEYIFIEAESFTNRGGWVIDQQSMDVMGSAYMLAHGLGIPVSDAETAVDYID